MNDDIQILNVDPQSTTGRQIGGLKHAIWLKSSTSWARVKLLSVVGRFCQGEALCLWSSDVETLRQKNLADRPSYVDDVLGGASM